MMRQIGAKGATREPRGSKIGTQGVSKNEHREGRNIKTQKVEKLTNHKKKKEKVNEILKSEHVDNSFILQQKIFTPRN